MAIWPKGPNSSADPHLQGIKDRAYSSNNKDWHQVSVRKQGKPKRHCSYRRFSPRIADTVSFTSHQSRQESSIFETFAQVKMTPSHHIVQLDGNVQLLTPDFPHTFEKYISTKPSEIAERLREATICIATGTRMTYDTLKTCGPKLQLLLSLGVGYDNFDIRAIKERNLTLVNVPAQNTESVAEHAYAVLGAVKRNIVPLHRFTVEGVEWEKNSGTVSQFKRR